MLKLRTIGICDYSVIEGEQRIGRIRLASERMPSVWLWNVTVHLTGGLPTGSAKDLEAAKAFGQRAHAERLALERHRPFDRRIADGFSQRP